MPKHVLVMAPASPPAGGSHATRIAALVEALHVSGFEVTLITAKWDEAQKAGSKQFQQILEFATVCEAEGGILRRTARAVGQIGAKSGRMRRYIQRIRAFTRSRMIPDTYATWIPNAVRLGTRLHQDTPFDLVISSGAPFSSHIAGYEVSRRTNTPLALDYGDPWVYEPGRPRRGIRLLIERKIESAILAYASIVSVTTKPTIDLYRDRYRGIIKLIILAPMGFDKKDFEVSEGARPNSGEARVLRIAYTGRICEEYRSVHDLAKCLDELGTSHPPFCIEFFGSELGSVRHELRKYQDKGLVRFHEPVDHLEYIKVLKSYDGLILFGNNNKIQIPGKLADYLAAAKNILYFPNIQDEGSDPTLLLARAVQNEGVFVGRRSGEFGRFLEACQGEEIAQEAESLKNLDWHRCFSHFIDELKKITESDNDCYLKS